MAAAAHFDCVILGGGSGGIAFARRAAAYGAKVAVVECDRIGGTCVNVGCVPKKAMWFAANIFEGLRGYRHLGIDFVGTPRFSWTRLLENRNNYIQRLNRIYESNLVHSNVTLIRGWARLVKPASPTDHGDLHSVVVNDNSNDNDVGADGGLRQMFAKHVLLATGGKPKPLEIPGGTLCIDSDGFFALKQQPRRVGIIGAGYIAVEIACVMQALGTEAHLFVRHEAALRKFDSMVQEQTSLNLKSLGVKIHTYSIPSSVAASVGGLHLSVEGGNTHGPFDCIINATGRVPRIDDGDIKSLGVRVDPVSNHVLVDEFQKTNVDGIFAVGDICGKVELTPMAICAGRRLADRLYGQLPHARADYSLVPTVVFSHPPIATIGMTESEAKALFGDEDIKVYEETNVNMLYGVYDIPPNEKPKTVIKLVCRISEGEKILGLHIVGMAADEMMQGFAVAIKMGAKKADLDACVAIHPTASEEVVTLPIWGLSNTAH